MSRQPNDPKPDAEVKPEAPSPTITIAEPETANRPYKPPALISEEELAALAPRRIQSGPQMITDGHVTITAEGDRILAQRTGDVQPANRMEPGPPPPLSPRALAKRAAEAEAGRRAVARATEQLAHRPPVVRPPKEIAAEGSNTPVFRPGDFREYANMRQKSSSKDSGSSVLQRVKQSLPEG